jgi:hypothetical protein
MCAHDLLKLQNLGGFHRFAKSVYQHGKQIDSSLQQRNFQVAGLARVRESTGIPPEVMQLQFRVPAATRSNLEPYQLKTEH